MIYTPQFIENVRNSNFVKNIVQNNQVAVDNSEGVQWGGCFAAGLYYGGLRRVSARSRSPLAFGNCLHVGLEAYFKGDKDYLKLALAEAATCELDRLGDPKRNMEMLSNLLVSYVLDYERSSKGKFDIMTLNGKPLVEESFSVPLGAIQLPDTRHLGPARQIELQWLGKIDLLTNYLGKIAPVDHKSTTVMGEKFVDDKVRSTQMLGYTYAANYLSKVLFDGAKVFGVRINALAMRANGFEFKVFDIPMPDWKIAEWVSETLTMVRQWLLQLDLFLETGLVAPTREHCVTKYGKCPYFDVCDSLPMLRDRMIFDDNYYYVSKWSPLGE